ncbi:DinB family protein [Hymenobacter rubripertinctus]|uniref:DinB family protein n=1 Tax=Hymenobacter rubripertinctus TaxID=2029981 RepID=A0A418QRE1_9BACT|nr:DinB family protein [Hymenobacter rubripertinctus]RIY07786.1 DinB family protein [Hymenobacter rubripertinctus]
METPLATTPAQTFLAELTAEADLTRRVLARVPLAASADWQPHPKSMTLRQLARHTAELAGFIQDTLDNSEIDLAAFEHQQPAPLTDTEALLTFFAERVQAAQSSLRTFPPDALGQRWVLRHGPQVLIDQTRAEVMRQLISHLIHHRGQLTVYLRLLDVPVPGTYGPSADEPS